MGSAQRGPGRKCWPAAAKLSSGGQTAEVGLGVVGGLRALLQEPLVSRAEHSVLMISVNCVKVCMIICLYVSMV